MSRNLLLNNTKTNTNLNNNSNMNMSISISGVRGKNGSKVDNVNVVKY